MRIKHRQVLMEVTQMVHHPEPADNTFRADALALRARGLTLRPIAEALGVSYSRVQRFFANLKKAEANGAPSTPKSAPTATLHKNDTAVHLPVSSGAPQLERIEQRLAVLEVFVSTLQRQALPVNGAPAVPKGAPTTKRGFVIARDLSGQIDAYAETHHLQVKQILDTALREFFAGRGWLPAEGQP
jgi:hypothetical protein